MQGAALADLITSPPALTPPSWILDPGPGQGSCCHLPPPSRARLVLVLVSVTRPSRGHEWSPDTGRPRPPGHQPPAANVWSIAAGYKIPIIVQIKKVDGIAAKIMSISSTVTVHTLFGNQYQCTLLALHCTQACRL